MRFSLPGLAIGSILSTTFTAAQLLMTATSQRPWNSESHVRFVLKPQGLPKSLPFFWIVWAFTHLSSWSWWISLIGRRSWPAPNFSRSTPACVTYLVSAPAFSLRLFHSATTSSYAVGTIVLLAGSSRSFFQA